MLRYIAFDFHHQTLHGLNYDKLSALIQLVHDDILSNQFFEEKEKQVLKTQLGVCRTNCLDNLDRTNAVQTLLGRHVLAIQLRSMHLMDSSSLDFNTFDSIFKNVWANNGDMISHQYTGTGALKSDFARTGTRNLNGVINDGINSVTRYCLNNFYDGYRQDCYDLFLGNYTVDPNMASPFRHLKIARRTLYTAAVFIGTLMLITYVFFPQEAKLIHRVTVSLLFCGTFFFGLQYLRPFLISKPLLVVGSKKKSKQV